MNKFPVHFNGISVFLPDTRVEAINKEIDDVTSMMSIEENRNFNPIRIIGNICIYHRGNRNAPLKTFKKAVEFRVQYNFYDVIQCGGDINKLKLAYWDGEKWIVVSDDEHNYQILPPTTAPLAEFTIEEWAGDPPLAWGR